MLYCERVLDLVLGVIVAVLVALLVLQSHRGRQQKQDWVQRDAQRILDHTQALEQRERAHQGVVAQLESGSAAMVADARSAADAADARVDRFQYELGRSIGWGDQVSRQLLITACTDIGVDGVLATNVTFVPRDAPPDRPYVAQIDHVLLTDSFALIVENKYWRGLVFADRTPSSVHRALGLLLDESKIGKTFAIQMTSNTEGGIGLLVHSEFDSPRTQVRRQAARLKEFIQDAGGSAPWFHTCVLYSHPKVEVFADESSPAAGSPGTVVATGLEDLRAKITKMCGKPRAGAGSPLSIAPMLEQLGADMYGLGDHAQRWTSPLPATYRTPTRTESAVQ